jgi:hypothetical protein
LAEVIFYPLHLLLLLLYDIRYIATRNKNKNRRTSLSLESLSSSFLQAFTVVDEAATTKQL